MRLCDGRTLQSNGSIWSRNFCMSGMFSVEVTKSGMPYRISAHGPALEGQCLHTPEAMGLVDGTNRFDFIALRIITH